MRSERVTFGSWRKLSSLFTALVSPDGDEASVLGAAAGECPGTRISRQGASPARAGRSQYDIWARRIAELIAGTTRAVLEGHSFGASVLLKYLAESAPRPPFTGLFLLATPFWGPDFPEFVLPPRFGMRLRDVSPLYLYHSRDDSEVPFEHLERYSAALPQAIVRALDGRGHEFNQSQFPEVVADIRRAHLPCR